MLNVSYASVTGSRLPLWIAKDAGLFEKHGLNVNLVVIAAGTAAIGALVGGDVEVLGAPGATTMVSAAKGLPVAIIGTFGPAAWKLAAHPSITSAQELRGKTVGISRLGTSIEFSTRRALLKLGLTPGKDVNILATGLGESNKRILVMLQGKIDATLVSADNLFEAETKGLKVQTSPADPRAIPTNWRYSLLPSLMAPSMRFIPTELAARLIWSTRLNVSSLGNFFVTE